MRGASHSYCITSRSHYALLMCIYIKLCYLILQGNSVKRVLNGIPPFVALCNALKAISLSGAFPFTILSMPWYVSALRVHIELDSGSTSL